MIGSTGRVGFAVGGEGQVDLQTQFWRDKGKCGSCRGGGEGLTETGQSRVLKSLTEEWEGPAQPKPLCHLQSPHLQALSLQSVCRCGPIPKLGQHEGLTMHLNAMHSCKAPGSLALPTSQLVSHRLFLAHCTRATLDSEPGESC